MPIRVWRPEGWKPRRARGVSIGMRIGVGVVRTLAVPLRPIGWLLKRTSLRRFRRTVVREFEGAFPGRVATVVRANTTHGWPVAEIDIGGLRVAVWSHMDEYGASIDAASSAEARQAVEAIRGKPFGSVAEVADAAAEAVRQTHAERKVEGNSAQAGDLR